MKHTLVLALTRLPRLLRGLTPLGSRHHPPPGRETARSRSRSVQVRRGSHGLDAGVTQGDTVTRDRLEGGHPHTTALTDGAGLTAPRVLGCDVVGSTRGLDRGETGEGSDGLWGDWTAEAGRRLVFTLRSSVKDTSSPATHRLRDETLPVLLTPLSSLLAPTV